MSRRKKRIKGITNRIRTRSSVETEDFKKRKYSHTKKNTVLNHLKIVSSVGGLVKDHSTREGGGAHLSIIFAYKV